MPRSNLAALALAARDAPEKDDDSACTELLGVTGRVMSYYCRFARSHGSDLEQTIRINKVTERARAHLRR